MDIILKILMIIGIILLVLLGLILTLIVIILAAPIKYRASASADDGDIAVNAIVKWLLFIKVQAVFENKELDYAVKLFGIQVFPRPVKTKKAKMSEEKEETKAAEKETEKLAEKAESEVKEFLTEKTDKEAAKTLEKKAEKIENSNKPESSEKEETTETVNASADEDASEEEKETIRQKIDKLINKIKDVLDICTKEKDEIEVFFKSKSTKYTFEVLKKDIFKLIDHIRPRNLRGEVEFGFDDPSTTGYTLAALSAFYGLYCESLDITPDFTQKVLKGNVSFSGRIFLGYIVYIGLDVYLRKRVRRFIRNVIGLKDVTIDNIDAIKSRFLSE